ncbi:hypothetical protein SOCEGT47_010560 [Sorangium cellulosum]|jgi:hypothetical protein|uniref:Uncharacterized protein n=1 Tax=Sorangium cellulosum TaxID=56 RepID=A0A4P2PV62_SORCE|nr:hypothetical protein [Sorangium cellulosum]AUX20584.1 hypothetical protein SOCEGT47_010560 [Sorangium cellulosum]
MMRSSTSAERAGRPLVLGWALTAALVTGCQDDGKTSQKHAAELCAKLAPVVAEDVRQVRTGLPAGSQKLAELTDVDPGANLLALQRAIAGARASVKDLQVAKGTFFSFADPSGTVLRSEADPDMLANRSVLAAFPELRKVLAPGSGVVEAFGEMQEMRGVRNGPDLQWVAVHPVQGSGSALKGLFVTGWSFRAYAYRLQEAAKHEIAELAKRDGLKSIPLLYVFAWKGGKAYGGPVTPDVNTEALEKLDLSAKTASGPWSGTVEITGRTFGAAAQRTPELAPDAGVAALVSTL